MAERSTSKERVGDLFPNLRTVRSIKNNLNKTFQLLRKEIVITPKGFLEACWLRQATKVGVGRALRIRKMAFELQRKVWKKMNSKIPSIKNWSFQEN